MRSCAVLIVINWLWKSDMKLIFKAEQHNAFYEQGFGTVVLNAY